jgi:hypothetical protein
MDAARAANATRQGEDITAATSGASNAAASGPGRENQRGRTRLRGYSRASSTSMSRWMAAASGAARMASRKEGERKSRLTRASTFT